MNLKPINNCKNLDYCDTYSNSNPHDDACHAQFLDIPYLKMLRTIMAYGQPEMDRTGVGTKSIFGMSARYDLRERFPLFTHKKLSFRWIAEELLWILSGDTCAKTLEDRGITIWKEWGDPDTRELGPVYGDGMRRCAIPYSLDKWEEDQTERKRVDQLFRLLMRLRNDPGSRRHIITLWNPHTVDECALPPCHGITIHFKIQRDGRNVDRLHCCMYQRSCDMLLGVPYNVASYSLLTCLIAGWLGIRPGFFTHMLGDAHIYRNHEDQVRELLERTLVESPQLEVHWPCQEGPMGGVAPHRLAATESVQLFLKTISRWPEEADTLWGLSRVPQRRQIEADGRKSKVQLSYEVLNEGIFRLHNYTPHPAIVAEVAV